MKGAVCWFVLCNCVTMRGANNMNFSILFYFCVESADLFHQQN